MFNTRRIAISVFVGMVFLTACQTGAQRGPLMLEAETERPDGSQIDWTLTGRSGDVANRILYVAQGSGCLPSRASANVDLLAQAMPDYVVLTIEKYGVQPDDTPDDPINSCSESYFANHTVSQRVEDAKAVLSDLRQRGLLDHGLVLFGGSEGGAVVSILSHEVGEANAVIVFSTGTGLTMAEFFPMVVPPPVAEQMMAVFEQARANPESGEIAGGNSYKWWADVLDRRLSDDLIESGIPVLIVHGENDTHAPIATARAARDAFAGAGAEGRLTYWERADRDHKMVDPNGQSHMREELLEIADWVRDQDR